MKETLKKYYLMLMNNRQRYGSWMKKTMVMGAMAVMMSFNAGVVEAGADIGDVFKGEVSNQVKFGKYNDDPGIVYLVGTGGSENGKVVAKTFSEAAIREMMKTGGTDAILLKAPKDGIDYAVNSWEITKYDADNNIIKDKSATITDTNTVYSFVKDPVTGVITVYDNKTVDGKGNPNNKITEFGAAGKDGKDGLNGIDGKSVTVTQMEGGVKVTDGFGNVAYVKDGKDAEPIMPYIDGMIERGFIGDNFQEEDFGTVAIVGNGECLEVLGGAKGNLSENNIAVIADENKLNIKLAEQIDLGDKGSVTRGDTVINNDGLTIKDGPTITKTLVDVAGNKIINVAAGEAETDVVNMAQLNEVNTKVENNTKSINELNTKVEDNSKKIENNTTNIKNLDERVQNNTNNITNINNKVDGTIE